MNRGRTVLLLTNHRLDESSGHAARFKTRVGALTDRGWNVEIGFVEPTPTGTLGGLVRCIRKARQADIINSVSNPPQLHIVGALLARLTSTPWVAEFRDPLLNNPDVNPDSHAATLRRRLERYIVANADAVVWYNGIQIPDDYFETAYPDLDTSSVRKLPYIGFEADTFASIEPETYDPFTITYAGSFYEGWIEPHTFIRGLGEYVNGTSDIRAQFYGDWSSEYDRVASNSGVTDYIETHEFVPHTEIVGILKGSDALLYIGGQDPRNARNLPTKLYDYIGARRPIIAVVDPSFRIAQLIDESGFGTVVNPGDRDGIADAIERIRNGKFDYDPSGAENFTRERSNDAYAKTLESVV